MLSPLRAAWCKSFIHASDTFFCVLTWMLFVVRHKFHYSPISNHVCESDISGFQEIGAFMPKTALE